jgi:hypothetical protein
MGASGNTGFLGALDALLDLTRDGSGTRRRLEVVGRWETPTVISMVPPRISLGFLTLRH